MKLYEKKTWLLAFAMSCIVPVMGQETIWSENFNLQTDGLDNGNYGPITSANGKWQLAIIDQGGAWMGSSDYIKVSNDLIEGKDTDNRGEWNSVPIDISGHSSVSVSIDFSESGNHEVTDTLAAYYALDGGALTAFETNGVNVDDFTSVIASTEIPMGNSLQVYVHLKNNSGTEFLRFDNVVVTGTAGNTPPDPEPTNHITNLDFTAITATEFTVNWTDATGENLPHGYLVKISNGAIVAPTDGVAEVNSAFVINIAQGLQTASFNALTANTTYNVSIFPYSNSEAVIDYKLEPENYQLTTNEAVTSSVVFISEIADPNNEIDGRFVELYNHSNNAIDLSGWKLQRYTNNSTTASSPLNLSGTIGAHSTFVIGKANFLAVYGFEPNMNTNNSVVDSNGDDTIELINSNDVRADIFGVPGVDGSGTAHEFEDGRAERNVNISTGNTSYTASEWTVDNDSGGGDGIINAPDGFDPGEWIGSGPIQINITTDTNEDNYQLTSGEALHISNGAVLRISNGGLIQGTVSIASGSGIEISSGTLVSTNTIILEDGAFLYENGGGIDHTGSFIVKRNTTTNTTAFNFLSSPVLDADIQAVFAGSNVVSYNPTNFVSDGVENLNNNSAWEYHTSGMMEEGRGYAVNGSQVNITGIRSFSGTPNTGNYLQTVHTSNNANPHGESWNLVGNPYPSPIQIGDFLTSNTSVIENGVYFWDDTVEDYVTKNSGMNGADLIAVGQGFFVQAKVDENLSFTNSMRRGNAATFFKKAASYHLELGINDFNGNKNVTKIAVAEDASDGKDAFYDSKKMFGNPQLSIYSLLSDDAYALQGVSNVGTKQIPIGIRTASAGVFEINMHAFSESNDYKFFIEDKLLDKKLTFETDKQQVQLTEGKHDKRFVLHLLNTKNIADEIFDQQVSYSLNKGFIEFNASNYFSFLLFDFSGRIVRRNKGSRLDVNNIPSGIYFIQVKSAQGIQYVKLML